MDDRAKKKFDMLEGVHGYCNNQSVAICDFFLCVQEFRAGFFSGDLFEIGVLEGKFSTLLGMHLRERETLYLNDIHDHLDEVGRAIAERTGTPGKLVPLHKFSSMVDQRDIPDRSVRFMHVDGDHSRRSIAVDLDLAARVVRAEGIVVLDDFLLPEYLAVTYGAFEWMTRNPSEFELILAGFGKAYLCRHQFVPYYMGHFNEALPRHLRQFGIDDFTLIRGTFPSDCVAVGIQQRRYDRDIITNQIDIADPAGPSGRILHL